MQFKLLIRIAKNFKKKKINYCVFYMLFAKFVVETPRNIGKEGSIKLVLVSSKDKEEKIE